MQRSYRKSDLATRYAITVRSIERMIADGRMPQPDVWIGRHPRWFEETITTNERKNFAEKVKSPPAKRVAGEPSAQELA